MLCRFRVDQSRRTLVHIFTAAPVSVATERSPLESRSADDFLQFLVEFAARAGNKNAPGGAAFAVFHSLHDSRRLAAFRAIGALRRVHNLLTVCSLCDLRHVSPSI